MPIILRRILAGIIDFYIACAVGVTVVAIITLGELPMTVFTATVYLFSTFAYMVLRDKFFKNASIGKKILRIHVVENNKELLTLLGCIKRNITLILVPVEVILLPTTRKRLGDLLAKTEVVRNTVVSSVSSNETTK